MNKENHSVRDVSVILPTYNEKENIKRLISEILENMGKNVEILVVDDDSPDGTWKIVEDMAKENNNIILLRRMNKRGLTSALTDGIKLAKGNIIAWMDTDLSMPHNSFSASGDFTLEGSIFKSGTRKVIV